MYVSVGYVGTMERDTRVGRTQEHDAASTRTRDTNMARRIQISFSEQEKTTTPPTPSIVSPSRETKDGERGSCQPPSFFHKYAK